ncbi:MAG TPA: hypothetical protein PLL69_07940, partial [Gemmatimonadales bacterium]|nr:hypothetical protein [Gemmatimonadales bacterium]
LDSLLFKVAGTTGASRSILFTPPLWEYLVVQPSQGGKRGLIRPFGVQTVMVDNGQALVVGLGNELRLDEYDLDGRWLRSLRGPVEHLALTKEWRDADFVPSVVVHQLVRGG